MNVDELLQNANDWNQEMEKDGETPTITREQFMERMELESIEVMADGSFQFWFADGDIFTNGYDITPKQDETQQELLRQILAEWNKIKQVVKLSVETEPPPLSESP